MRRTMRLSPVELHAAKAFVEQEANPLGQPPNCGEGKQLKVPQSWGASPLRRFPPCRKRSFQASLDATWAVSRPAELAWI